MFFNFCLFIHTLYLVIRRPLQGSFKANDGKTYSIVAPQVPSAGPILVSLLNIYETLKQSYGVGLNNTDPNAWHGIVEAIKFGTAQKTRLGDPGFTADMDKFIAHVIDKRAAKDLVDAIDPVKLDINRTFSPDHYADEFMYSIPDEQVCFSD